MTSTTMETVNCRRFLAAWTRFEARKEQHLDDDIITNYKQLAQHFQQLMQDSDELKALESDVGQVLATIAALQKREEGVVTSRRIPRVSELLKLREARNHAAKIDVKALIEEQKVQSTFDENIEKEVCATLELRSDLTADDFKSMLKVVTPQEEKLSTKAIRKRLGLVDRLETQKSASETVAREEQESIQSEMMSLAKQLKDRTQTINQSLAEDVKILDAVGQSAQSNTVLLDRENAKLKEQLASSIGLWTSLWLVAVLVVVFVATYFYMKLFSRRW
ncbi:unnamed protein product [Peronospora destructor]|uniref:Vesicle transport protein USE1 n=1 Tax=Peronospora destructor TaxID=86335 RepID=A0AAV0UH13_9STRA|nr:unnamed protein product [Peronospora destructor]